MPSTRVREQWQWEVNLLGSTQINAFCMPGGKIAFYSGIITKLKLTDDEIAIVMGHEITHALKEHGVEQAKNQAYGELAARAGGALLSSWLGIDPNLTEPRCTRAANGLFQLRFSRGDESEADAVGLELAARAGYDPRAGVVLWTEDGAGRAGRAAAVAVEPSCRSQPHRGDPEAHAERAAAVCAGGRPTGQSVAAVPHGGDRITLGDGP